MIVIKRDSGWVDRFRNYLVVLNDEVIGEIKNGEEKSFELPHGNHQLKLTIDWCNSNSLDINYDGKTTINCDCGSSLRGFKAFGLLLYVFSRPDEYLWLKRRAA